MQRGRGVAGLRCSALFFVWCQQPTWGARRPFAAWQQRGRVGARACLIALFLPAA